MDLNHEEGYSQASKSFNSADGNKSFGSISTSTTRLDSQKSKKDSLKPKSPSLHSVEILASKPTEDQSKSEPVLRKIQKAAKGKSKKLIL